MLNKSMLKSIAWVVLIAYFSVFHISGLAAAATTPEELRAMRQIYAEKIRRLEAEMNNARGARNTMLTIAVTSFFVGGGVIAGAGGVQTAVEDIEIDDPEDQENVDTLVSAMDATKGFGTGIVGAGGVALLGYLVYATVIGSKQREIDNLRAELETQYEPEGLTPEYLQKNESVAAVLEEIEAAKKSAASARSFQSFCTRIAMGGILSGGFLYLMGVGGRTLIEDLKLDETDDETVDTRDDALTQTDNLKLTGLILLGVGAASGVTGFVFGQRAKSKERTINNLEDGLLRVAERIDIYPRTDGFMVMYKHEF